MTDDSSQFFDLRDVRQMISKWSVDCGRRVADKRESYGWDRRKFAVIVGTTEATITRIEQGVLNPRDHLKLAISAALQVEVEALWSFPRKAEVYTNASVAA